jgi:glutamate 5-kinase
MDMLMDHNTVMIINENDPVSVHEIEDTFGDNDRLSAMVASKVDADLLVILTDVDGMYDRHPEDPRARLIPLVDGITPEIEAMCGDSGSWRTKGGMKTKIEAARIVIDTGCDMVIANAREKDVLLRIMAGEDLGTLFKAPGTVHGNRERWIKLAKCSGAIKIDSGAAHALMNGSSLLPSGVIDVQGDFEAGDIISIVCEDVEVARGVADYSSRELAKIKGKQTHEIEKILGFKHYDNVVRRDNMVLTQEKS